MFLGTTWWWIRMDNPHIHSVTVRGETILDFCCEKLSLKKKTLKLYLSDALHLSPEHSVESDEQLIRHNNHLWNSKNNYSG